MRDEQGVRLDVIDTGLGMSAEQRAALFQPFNRLGAENTAVAGNGLGLVITKHLLGLMGGSLTVQSELGQGSCFSVLMPAGHDVVAASSDAVAEVAPADQPVAATWACGRVLYVEDDAVNAILMTAVLGMRPRIQLQIATTGADALQAAQNQAPDLLLLDMHLPDTNGIDLLAAMRKIDGLEAVPAVMVSAGASQQDIDRARASGFGCYWTKPLDVDKTLAAVVELLGPGN